MNIKNFEILALFKGDKASSFMKLLNSETLDGISAYELSLIVPELEKQLKIIEENRVRISKKYFPLDENGSQSILKQKEDGTYLKQDGTPASNDQILEYNKGLQNFQEEYNQILEKDVKVEYNPIEIKKSELSELKLSAIDLIKLEKLIKIID